MKNGHKPQKSVRRRHRNGTMVEDEFSKALAEQGQEGQIMRMLYLRNPMDIYMRKVNDESIRH